MELFSNNGIYLGKILYYKLFFVNCYIRNIFQMFNYTIVKLFGIRAKHCVGSKWKEVQNI